MKKVLKTTNTIIYSLLFILLLVSFAIGFVLLCWPLYYLMIDLFNITNLTGVSKADLIFSFNELMSCLVFYKEPFSEGVFAFSESGMNHFLDCRILFTLDLVVFAISLPLFFVYLLLIGKGKIKIYHPFSASPLFLASFVPIILLGAFTIFALIDVDSAFKFFHSILFPGKTNWVFDPKTDPIINALPMEVFLSYGIIILSIIFIVLISVITVNSIRIHKNNNVRIYKSRR